MNVLNEYQRSIPSPLDPKNYKSLAGEQKWFSLVWFYGISTMVGYLMPYTVNPFCRWHLWTSLSSFFSIPLNDFNYFYVSLTIQSNISHFLLTVNDETIQFCVNAHFKCQTILFDPYIGPYQVLTLRTRADLGVMAVTSYSAFPNALALLEPNHQIIKSHIMTHVVGGGVLFLCREAVGIIYLGGAWGLWPCLLQEAQRELVKKHRLDNWKRSKLPCSL